MHILFLSGLFRTGDKPQNYYIGTDFRYLFGSSVGGKTVNEFTAMQTTAVYACVRIPAETLAALLLQLHRYTPGGKERVYDHPLYYLLHDEPKPEMTSLLIWGNAYARIIRDRLGRVQGLYPLRPDKMTVCRDDWGKIFYLYTKTGDENPNIKPYGQVVLQKEEVLHIPGLGVDGLVGYSPIAMARNAVGMTMACEEYGASFFANGPVPAGCRNIRAF